MDKKPLIGVSICAMVLLTFSLMAPFTQAVDYPTIHKEPKYQNFHWGKIIEAHCDSRFILNETNISNSLIVQKYFVFAIGRHRIDFFMDNYVQNIYGWMNDSWAVSDQMTIFKPIARPYFTRTPHLSDWGEDIKQGKWVVTLLVDGIVMDSEYCILPTEH